MKHGWGQSVCLPSTFLQFWQGEWTPNVTGYQDQPLYDRMRICCGFSRWPQADVPVPGDWGERSICQFKNVIYFFFTSVTFISHLSLRVFVQNNISWVKHRIFVYVWTIRALVCSDYFATSGLEKKRHIFSHLGSGHGCRWKYECAWEYKGAAEVLPQWALRQLPRRGRSVQLPFTNTPARMYAHAHSCSVPVAAYWHQKKKRISVNGNGGGGLLLHLKRKREPCQAQQCVR